MYQLIFGICRHCFRLRRTQKPRWENSHEECELGRRSDSHDTRRSIRRRSGYCRMKETPQGIWKTRSLGIPCGDRTTRRLRSAHPGLSTCSMIKAAGGQILKLPEAEARLQFSHLVFAPLGAQRKEKPRGVISARVLFDGSNGIPVNRRIRLREQERAPMASDLKRCMREKSPERGAHFLIDGGRCRSVPAGAGGRARLAFTGVPGRGGRRCIYEYRWALLASPPPRTTGRALPQDWTDYSIYSRTISCVASTGGR